MSESYVLDSHAVLAYQFGKEGEDKLEEILLAAELCEDLNLWTKK